MRYWWSSILAPVETEPFQVSMVHERILVSTWLQLTANKRLIPFSAIRSLPQFIIFRPLNVKLLCFSIFTFNIYDIIFKTHSTHRDANFAMLFLECFGINEVRQLQLNALWTVKIDPLAINGFIRPWFVNILYWTEIMRIYLLCELRITHIFCQNFVILSLISYLSHFDDRFSMISMMSMMRNDICWKCGLIIIVLLNVRLVQWQHGMWEHMMAVVLFTVKIHVSQKVQKQYDSFAENEW